MLRSNVWTVGVFALAILAAVDGKSSASESKPRDDGHIAGSLVDLLDQDDWERPVAGPELPVGPPMADVKHAHSPGGASDATHQRPVAKQAPSGADPDAATRLEALVARRQALVGRCDFFQLIDKTLKAEQEFNAAKASLVQANVAAQKAIADINIARVQKNEALEVRGREHLTMAEQAARRAGEEVQAAANKCQQLWGQLQPNIEEFLTIYHAMRQFVVHDRASPRLAAARDVLTRACGRQGDFHEGHVLASLCEIYVGNGEAAADHLRKGTFFGQKLFFAWPPANDMCLAYLLLGQTDAVDPWVRWVEKIDEKRKTPTRCWLVAMHAVIECKDNQAKSWFDRCKRRLIATAKKQKRQPVMPAEVAGAWASFLLTCPNTKFRDLAKAVELLEGLQPEVSWHVARGHAAVAAEQGRWPDAVRNAALAAEHGPGVLEPELSQQLAAYKSGEPWTRRRPATN